MNEPPKPLSGARGERRNFTEALSCPWSSGTIQGAKKAKESPLKPRCPSPPQTLHPSGAGRASTSNSPSHGSERFGVFLCSAQELILLLVKLRSGKAGEDVPPSHREGGGRSAFESPTGMLPRALALPASLEHPGAEEMSCDLLPSVLLPGALIKTLAWTK